MTQMLIVMIVYKHIMCGITGLWIILDIIFIYRYNILLFTIIPIYIFYTFSNIISIEKVPQFQLVTIINKHNMAFLFN